MRASRCSIALSAIIAALSTVARAEDQFAKVDLCALVTADELSKALEVEAGASSSASRATGARCKFSISHANGTTDLYTVWLTSPGHRYAESGQAPTAVVVPSARLAAVIGSQPLARSEVIKRVWDYIKRNGLQDQQNRRMINTDAKLRSLFEDKKQVSMFELTARLNRHLRWPKEEVGGLGGPAYLVPETNPSGWSLHVVQRDKFQLHVLGKTAEGVRKIAALMLPKVQV